jgi:uncharacterized repeat protein (TIGR01451 family)
MTRVIPTLLALFCLFQVQAQTVILNVTHATCGNNTGSILASAFGGAAPYTYIWSNSPGQPGPSSQINLPPGEYTVWVSDSNGNSATATGEVLLVPGLFPDIVPAEPVYSCDGGCNGYYNYFLPLSGATMPFTVTFDPPGPNGGASPNGLYFGELCTGIEYTVTVTDVNGCSGTVGPISVEAVPLPVIVSSTIVGSCPGGATGSMELLFNQLDSVWINGPNGWVTNVTTNPMIATNLAPGTYTVGGYTVPDGSGSGSAVCEFFFTLVVPVTTDPCGSISGVLYADLDNDCDQAPVDLGLPFRVIALSPGGHYTLTDADGSYSTELFYDDYTLDMAVAGYESTCVGLPAPFLLNAVTPSTSIDLPMEVLFGADVRAFLNAGVHRPGFPVTYTPSVHNEGPFGFTDLTLDLFFDPILNYVSATGSPDLVAAGHLQWEIATLGGFDSRSFTVEFTVPPQASLLGVVLSGNAVVTPQSPDADPSNDDYGITRTIIGAYDPNDKLAQTDFTNNDELFFLDLDSYVDYTIRFQNTGTAEAINVFLIDTIAAEYDLSTLRILGASHEFEASLLPGRVLRFDFPNIMLPDSTSDLLGSQGFASFRLWPLPGLELGDHLLNAADIFFDFNEPIRTNTSDLMAEFSVGIAEAAQTNVRVFPNPVRDALNIHVPQGNWSIEVFSMDGRIALSDRSSGELLGLNARVLAPGSYVLRLIDDAGTVLNTRFMKE